MNEPVKYTVSIIELPTEESRHGAFNFFSQRLSGKSADEIMGYLAKLPLVITRQADSPGATALQQQLEALGARVLVEPALTPTVETPAPATPAAATPPATTPPAAAPEQYTTTPPQPPNMPGPEPPRQNVAGIPISSAAAVNRQPAPGSVCSRHTNVHASAICARCGDFVCSTCAFAMGNYQYCPQCAPIVYNQWQTQSRGLPWDYRGELGVVKSIIQTVKLLFKEPATFFTQMRLNGGYSSPIYFSLYISIVYIVPLLFTSMAGGFSGPGFGFGIAMLIIFVPVMFVVYVAMTIVGLFIGGLIYYLAAYLLGARLPFESVFRMSVFVTQSLNLVFMLFNALGQIGQIGPMLSPGAIGMMLMVVFSIVMVLAALVYLVLQIYYMYLGGKFILRLSQGRALLFGFSPIIFGITFIMALGILVGLIVAAVQLFF